MLIIADKLMSADIEKHSVSDSSFDILSGKEIPADIWQNDTNELSWNSNCMIYNF